MEDRYEIRGKIGQGGLGAVYRGYDTRMNREVAIKRISVTQGNAALQEESTRQLIKEAGALASLQHPHIVTVYDVGSDDDGPYVVMELISGETLDEIIERAPLTWQDFRELAIQTQEALIAAQELSLIHSDIKPSNLMLTWLPSGKFQIKIVDFGLATLTQSQSQETLDEIEAVFGSIYFMAPEQFERIPLDSRTDIYAMACVYYQALTRTYPFKGETAHDVMVAHLHHQVIPIQDVRADIPIWACDWIMWMLNRLPGDRPESAREALQVFFLNDKIPKPPMSLGKVVMPKAPRSRPPGQATIDADITKPKRVILDPRMAPSGYEPPIKEPAPPEETKPEPPAPEIITAPQPLLPPEGSKPSIYTALIEIPDHFPPTPTAGGTYRPAKKFTPPTEVNGSGKAKKFIVSALAIVLLMVLGIMLRNRIQASRASEKFGKMLEAASLTETTDVLMTGQELNQFLEMASGENSEEKQKQLFILLALAKPTDGSDFDSTLGEFVTTSTQLLPEVRLAMIQGVLEKRMTRTMVPRLLEYARSSKDILSAIAALKAIRSSLGDEQFESLLSTVQGHPNEELRKAAEDDIMEIVKKTNNRHDLSKRIQAALNETTSSNRSSLLRLKTAAGN